MILPKIRFFYTNIVGTLVRFYIPVSSRLDLSWLLGEYLFPQPCYVFPISSCSFPVVLAVGDLLIAKSCNLWRKTNPPSLFIWSVSPPDHVILSWLLKTSSRNKHINTQQASDYSPGR